MASAEVVEKLFQSGKYASNAIVAGDPANPAVMLIHGAGPGAHAGSNWSRCIPDLAKEYFVIAPDMIGFGKSELPETLPMHAISWMGLRVEQMLGLLDHFGIKRTHIVGNSMGGALTVQLITEAPERFDKVALMGAIGAPITSRPQELIRLLAFYADPRLSRYRELMRSFVHDPDTFPGMEDIIQTRYRIAVDPEVRRTQEAMFATMGQGLETLVVPPSVLGRLPHHVLLVHGRQDRIVPLETSLYFLKHFKHAELVVLDRCGHWAQAERWDVMGPMLMRHFSGKGIH